MVQTPSICSRHPSEKEGCRKAKSGLRSTQGNQRTEWKMFFKSQPVMAVISGRTNQSRQEGIGKCGGGGGGHLVNTSEPHTPRKVRQ